MTNIALALRCGGGTVLSGGGGEREGGGALKIGEIGLWHEPTLSFLQVKTLAHAHGLGGGPIIVAMTALLHEVHWAGGLITPIQALA